MTGNGEHRLTPFQEQCILQVEAVLGEAGRSLQALEWRPDNPAVSEPGAEFLHARVAGTPIEMWIYDDQADVKAGSGRTNVFESLDFRSTHEQIAAFISAVLELLETSTTRASEVDADIYEVETDPTWRAIFHAELAVWHAKSYADLRTALSDVCCVCYQPEGPDSPYQVEVQILENLPDYVHVMFAVCGPMGWAAPTLHTSFLRYADGRLDA